MWSASIAGSIAAWYVGGAVLGGFCLVLTFCIGIRYLVKPDSDSERDDAGDAGDAGDALDDTGDVGDAGDVAVFNQRRAGEVKVSLLLLYGVSALVIALCWGLAGHRYLVAASLFTWGFGDAAAGLLGRRYGKNPLRLPFVDPHKTREGSFAFVVVGFVACALTLVLATDFGILAIVGQSAVAAVVGAYAEAVSKNGNDTVTSPLAVALVLIAFRAFLG